MAPPIGRTLLLVSWLVLACAWPAIAADAPVEKTRFDYALKLYMQGAYGSAVKEFKDYLKDYPKGEYSDDAMYWLGKYYQMNGNYDAAFEQFNKVVSLLPSSNKAPAAQYEIANYWFDPANPKHDYQKAVAEYLKMPFFYPDSPLVADSAYYGAACQIKLRDYKKAEEGLRTFLEKYPASELAPPAAYRLGLVLVLEGRVDDALASFQAVRDRYPAGLGRQDALNAIELIMRTKEKRPLAVQYAYGVKGGAPGMLSKPSGAALDMEGGLYVSDTGNGRVQRFKVMPGALAIDNPGLAPASLEKNLQPVKPAGVAIGPGGWVYITDSYMHRAQVFQPDGRLLLTIGRKGAEPGGLSSPSGIAVDEGGNIYVADTGNRRVDEFDGGGRFIRSIGDTGTSEDNLLKSPAGVAVDVEGNILVTDRSAYRICKYDRAGKLLMVFGTRTDTQFKLGEPAGIGVDGVGNVYVVDRDKPGIVVFDKDLKPLMVFPDQSGKKVFDDPVGLAVSGSGELFVVDQGSSQVVVVK